MSARILSSKAGVGLRAPHFEKVLKEKPGVSFLEIHSENFFALGGKAHQYLKDVAQHYPLSFHGVSLSLGSYEEPSIAHLKRLKTLVQEYDPALVSEHISWSVTDTTYLNDLLPLPYTEEALDILCRHISMVQNELGRPILMENPSAYLAFDGDGLMSEGFFVNQMVKHTGCSLLLDVNNVYVSAKNMGVDATEQLLSMPLDAVAEVHLAGFSEKEFNGQKILIDTHGAPVHEDVWHLYGLLLEKLGKPVPTLIEWDTDIPNFEILQAEANKANAYLQGFEGDVDVA